VHADGVFSIAALSPATWPDFAALVERDGGVWGGCWCMGFHAEGVGRHTTAAENRARKEERVRAGRAHAALVYAGDVCVGWCQLGRVEELPRIKHRRAYEAGGVDEEPPDWRITCFYVDRRQRRAGVAAAALRGALEQIAQHGGGVVESYPELVDGRRTSSSFLYNATVALFERNGFVRVRPLGKHHWVVRRTLEAA
jgi:ribosomal protein S18 acetylase RimI-like enzyme